MLNSTTPIVTHRLRHLSALRCRNFTLPDAKAPVAGIFFAINTIEPGDIGYAFVSPLSSNVKDPEWESLDLSQVSEWLLAAKAIVLTFFLRHDHVNTILFELKVYFSGLIPISQEKHFRHGSVQTVNEVYFYLDNTLYATPASLTSESCDQCMLPMQLKTTIPYKPSYNSEYLEELLVDVHLIRTQFLEVRSIESSVKRLEEFLAPVLELDAKREELVAQLVHLKRRLKSEQRTVSKTRLHLQRVANALNTQDSHFHSLNESQNQLDTRAQQIAQTLSARRQRLLKLSEALSLRTARLTGELLDVFGPELARLSPSEAVPVLQQFSSTNPLKSHSSTDLAAYHTPTSDGIPRRHSPPEPLHDATVSVMTPHVYEFDTASAAVSLGMVALLLRVTAAIFDLPLRSPVDLTEGVSKAKVVDVHPSDLAENNQNFPLHLPRSSVLPAYKYAIFLLNQNLNALHAICDVPRTMEDAPVWNFITLLQHCVLHRSQLRFI